MWPSMPECRSGRAVGVEEGVDAAVGAVVDVDNGVEVELGVLATGANVKVGATVDVGVAVAVDIGVAVAVDVAVGSATMISTYTVSPKILPAESARLQ
jgi:hypothetical protein